MGELIRIGAQEGAPGLGATIDSTGAWVTDLSLGGEPILFPRQTLVAPDGSEKVRGGMHVCSPYFGLPKLLVKQDEPQHGYAREVEWDVDAREDNLLVLSNLREQGYYEGLASSLSFRTWISSVGTYCFEARLRLTNMRLDLKRTRVAPGFHPYFEDLDGYNDLVTDVPEISLDGTMRDNNQLRSFALSKTNGRFIGMLAFGMPEAVKWTDRLGTYVCLEPVFSTIGSMSGDKDEKSEELGYKMSREYALRITAPW